MLTLNAILEHTLYKVKTKTDQTFIGTIDEVSEYFGYGVKVFERVAANQQDITFKDFFTALEKYETTNGYTYIEDFYNNVYAKR